MKIMNRIISVLIVMLMLLSKVTAFAATDSMSYSVGYEEGYDYGYARQDSKVKALDAYNDSFKDSRAYRTAKSDVEKTDKFVEREFRDGFVDGYNDGHDDKVNANQKLDYPEELGLAMGAIRGANDHQTGKKSDWRAALPASKNISNMFDLDKQSSSYRSSFITTFTAAFNEGYVDAYDKAAYEPSLITLEQGFTDGEDVGWIVGAAYGTKDFYAGRQSDFKRNLPTKSQITQQYSLSKDYIDYESGFISGFTAAYELAYDEAFREASMSESLNKAVSEIVPISGGTVVSGDGRFTVDVPSGTFYHDVSLNIIASFDVRNTSYGNLIKASDSYSVELENLSRNVDENKAVELSFEYYGDKFRGGIYRFYDNRWLYVPTTVKDGKMTAKINPRILLSQGTIFSAFVDENAAAFRDVMGHWASDEIEACVRRGVISGYGDNTFKPDNNITRAEFITMVSRAFNWNIYSFPGTTTPFKDASTFGNYADVIKYAAGYGYISGYGDGYFRPGNQISYAEVEIIMNRVLSYQNFRWADVANNMLYNNKERSGSFNNMNNKITRAEVAFMLYNTTQ